MDHGLTVYWVVLDEDPGLAPLEVLVPDRRYLKDVLEGVLEPHFLEGAVRLLDLLDDPGFDQPLLVAEFLLLDDPAQEVGREGERPVDEVAYRRHELVVDSR